MSVLQKTIAVFLVTILLGGCRAQPQPILQANAPVTLTSETLVETDPVTESYTPDTEPVTTEKQRIRPIYTDALFIYSLEEYDAFIAQIADHPSLVLTYHDIAVLGEFEDAFFYVTEPAHWASCIYGLRDPNGYIITFTIGFDEDSPNATPSYPVHSQPDIWDLRKLPQEEDGYVSYANVKYEYQRGNLVRITWRANGYRFYLRCEEDCRYFSADSSYHQFLTYPMDGESTFIQGLLSLETVEQTLAQIEAFVPKS